MSEIWCTECGNTGTKLDNTPCDCDKGRGDIKGDVVCLTIPEQYRGIVFDPVLLPDDLGSYYKEFMYNAYKDISSMKLRNKNMFIGSPAKHGKTIFAYACVQNLFRRGIATFPLFDVMELKRIMGDLDAGKPSAILDGISAEAVALYSSPYLFVRIPSETTYTVYDTIYTLTDRRTRRGHSTIYLYNGSWKFFAENDKKGAVAALVGDGSYCTIENKSFWIGE